jgi:hypothetical protein
VAKYGHKHILEWLVRIGAELGWGAQRAAASAGKLEILQYLHERGRINRSAFVAAAASGRIDVMIWLRRHDYVPNEKAMVAAAKNGQLEAAKWLSANNVNWTDKARKAAAHHSMCTLERMILMEWKMER